MRNAMCALFAVVAMACGTSSHPGSTADGDAPPETCAGHRATDACMNEDNFASCLERDAECPGAVLSLESCPLQFACP